MGEFGKLESQMSFHPARRGATYLSPVLPDARDRILSMGYAYCPVHTEIYGTYRNRDARSCIYIVSLPPTFHPCSYSESMCGRTGTSSSAWEGILLRVRTEDTNAQSLSDGMPLGMHE